MWWREDLRREKRRVGLKEEVQGLCGKLTIGPVKLIHGPIISSPKQDLLLENFILYHVGIIYSESNDFVFILIYVLYYTKDGDKNNIVLFVIFSDIRLSEQ